MAADRWQVFPGADGQFYFHRRAENGEIVATSEGYTEKDSAMDEAVRQASESGGTVELLDERP